VALPVTGKIHGLAALHRKRGNAVHLIPIRDALSKTIACSLAPRFNSACRPQKITFGEMRSTGVSGNP
jgi:hypothetical protein